ncbi:YdgA family protein [Kerstersia gyiorum]|uniref:YdgA family protein n=1 Tax=Kerstersia gyiorum TaxID=206506 RepID=UPI00214FEACB|nr:YdgA family protein [Kerstersia gyiorum]MCR4157359.1 YdgA family protein [Kerstersia gyiorum]
MKKTPIAIAVVGVLAVAYVGSSWYLGTKIEKMVDTQITRLNSRLASEFALNGIDTPPYLEKVSYERGIFSSEARYRVGIRGEEGSLVLHDAISHGPLPWAALSHGMFAPALAFSKTTVDANDPNAAKAKAFFGDKEPFIGYTRIGFGQTIAFDWKISPAKHSTEEVSIDFAGLNLEGTASTDGQEWDAKGGSAGLTVNDLEGENPFRLSFGKMDFVAKTERSAFDIGVGTSSLSIDDFLIDNIDNNSDRKISIKRIGVTSGVAEEGKTAFNANAVYSVNGINIGQQDFGDVVLDARLNRLDGAALQGLYKAYEDLMESGKLRTISDPSQILTMPGIQDNLIGLLSQAPQLLVTLDTTNTAGKSTLDLAVDTAAPAKLNQPGPEIIKRVHATLTLDKNMVAESYQRFLMIDGMPADTAKEQVEATLPAAMESLVEEGALTLTDDGKYTGYITFENGSLVINGDEVPPFMIPLLFGMLASGFDSPEISQGSAPELEEFRFEEEQVVPQQ